MTSLADLLQQSAAHAWLLIPTAILLGALDGLEPSHSKTMMAAFIIVVRGTVRQAILLGLAATLSHTMVVWIVALGGMWLLGGLNAEATEPYFQLASGVLIVLIASWMLWRTAREQGGSGHDHGHHHHSHHHCGHDDHHHHHGDHGHHHHEHGGDHHHHHHAPHDAPPAGLEIATGGHMDAHERAHAEDIRRFDGRAVTTGQIVLFGLTGGLIPCPGAITVLLLCLQLQRITLGAVLVLCFSIGLALTLVASGVIAAVGVRQVTKRWSGFEEAVRKAPYVSGLVILAIGLYVAVHAWANLPG